MTLLQTAPAARTDETRWLTPLHQAKLAAGGLCLPRFPNSEHDAVLVSTDEGAGEDHGVAWVDVDCAPVVWHARLAGIRIIESCQGGQPTFCVNGCCEEPKPAYLVFPSHRHMERFLAAADPDSDLFDPTSWTDDSSWWPESRRWPIRLISREWVLRFPSDWLPEIARRLALLAGDSP